MQKIITAGKKKITIRREKIIKTVILRLVYTLVKIFVCVAN